MQYGLVTKIRKGSMAVNDLDPFAKDDGPEDGEEGEDGWKGGFAVDDEEGDMVDF